MFCRHCGKKLDDSELICSQCGTKVNSHEPAAESPDPEKKEEDKKKGGGSSFLAGFLVTAAILLLGVLIALMLWFKFGRGSEGEKAVEGTASTEAISGRTESDEAALGSGEVQNGSEENGGSSAAAASEEVMTTALGALSDSTLAKTIAKYNEAGQGPMTIDVFADNYSPGPRDTSYAWDRTLFYTLEDVDPASDGDGRINGYTISRKMLQNAASGNEMEYEIYTSPSSGRVNKIVSIEYFSEYLEITDYYYDDAGRVSFIFVRQDINYVPSYAVPTKDGQRFYFEKDCMTKWRVVEGGAQKNYVIGQASANEGYNASGSVVLYSKLDAGGKSEYDTAERRMINAAYNTYNLVLAAESVTEITGYVYDEQGSPSAGAHLTLILEPSGEELFGSETEEDGSYRILVPSNENGYRLAVSKPGCATAYVYGVDVSGLVLSDYQDTVYLIEKSNDLLPVEVQIFDALNYAADGNGMERISDATVYFRSGVNNREGDIVGMAGADSNGLISMDLAPGMYTVQVDKTGYDTTYYNFVAKKSMERVQINASPTLASGEVRIVLTWGSWPADLDSHLFTPYSNVFGDSTYHIWYGNRSDQVGNNLDVDDTNGYGPETMTIPVLKDGLYKYYVADFTNCSGNHPASYDMSNSGARVDVYTSNGLTASFAVPRNTQGVIWEVFEIRNGAIVPIQRYYSNIEDKTWWHSDK